MVCQNQPQRGTIVMKIFNLFILIILSLNLFSISAPAQTKRKTIKKQKTRTSQATARKIPAEPITFKVLSEGIYSKVEEPFIFVAHNAETYAQLQTLVENLPAISAIDFNKTIILGAFAGTKNTGGWSVDVKKLADKVAVDVLAPPKDAMVTQALTTPYKIVFLPLAERKMIPLEFSDAWASKMKTYRVSSGIFEYSGGIAGIRKEFDIEGEISVLSYNDFVTLAFDLKGKAAEKARSLSEITSGTLKNGNIYIDRVKAGNFVDNPHPPLKLGGTIDETKLSLAFESLPTVVADGYTGRGKLEALKIK